MVEGDLNGAVEAASALLMGFSLSVYVAWEVGVMIARSMYISKARAAAGRRDLIATQQLGQEFEALQLRYWPLAVWASVLPATLAGFMMMGALAWKLLESFC